MGALGSVSAPVTTAPPKSTGPASAEESGKKTETANDFARLMREENKPAQDKGASGPAGEQVEVASAAKPTQQTAEESSSKPDEAREKDEDWPPAGLTSLMTCLFPAPSVLMTLHGPATSAGGNFGPSGGAAPLLAPPATALNVVAGAIAAAGAADTPLSQTTSSIPNAGAVANGTVTAQPTAVAATAVNATQVAIPLPDAGTLATALPKEWIASLSREVDTEPTSPIGNAAGIGSPAGTNLGLARIAVVNPMEAASPDLHGENFDEAIGSRLTWMAEQKIGHAHIRINPQELGPVEIRMRLDGERVHADFSSPQAEVRHALEQSLPKLRDMLAQHGFQLAQADVGQQHGDSRPPAPGKVARDIDSNGGVDGIAHTSSITAPQSISRGLLDAYA